MNEQTKTLRDELAMAAIQMAWDAEKEAPTGDIGPSYKGVARRAYLLADAMLDARAAALGAALELHRSLEQ